MGRYLYSLLVCWFVLFGASDRALGYPTPVDFDGKLTRWNLEPGEGPVYYQLVADRQDDLDDYGDLVDEAASLWNYAGGSYISYQRAGEEDEVRVTIHLVRNLKNGDFSSGYTVVDRYAPDGRPEHAAIFVHISAAYSYTGIAKTILHELGHGLGLGHTLIPEAIMSYSLDKNKFALDIDDEAAIARLYPSDGTRPRLAPGCAVGAGGIRKQYQANAALGRWLILAPVVLGIGALLQPMASMRSMACLARKRMSSGT